MKNSRALIELANACVKAKNWTQTERMGEHLAQLNPEAPWGAFYMSLGSLGQGKHQRSLWMSDLALKKAPRLGFLHYQKSRVLWEMGEYSLAIKSVNEAIKYDDRLSDAHLLLGQIYFRDRDAKRAVQHFKAVLAVEPNNKTAQLGLAESLYASKDQRAALKQFEAAAAQSPMDIPLRLRLAELYEGEKMYSEALAAYRRARELMASQRQPSSQVVSEIAEKIEFLEKMLGSNEGADKKVSQSRDSKKVRSK